MFKLTYCSKVAEGVGLDEVRRILKSASRNNQASGISGMLCFNNNYFLQCIEGGAAELNRLFQILSNDNRHTDVQLLSYGRHKNRCFANWSMGLVTGTVSNQKAFFRFMPGTAFDPYRLSGDAALRLLIHMNDLANTEAASPVAMAPHGH